MKKKELKVGDVKTLEVNAFRKITVKAVKVPHNMIAKCGSCSIFKIFGASSKAPCIQEHDPLPCSNDKFNVIWVKI